MGFVKAGTVSSSVVADMILEALKSNSIPSYKRDLGVGNYRRITCGYSEIGSEIYVDEEFTKEAIDIINLIDGNNEDDLDDTYADDDNELSEGNRKFHIRRSIFLCAWLIFIVAVVIFSIVVGR